LFSPQPKTGERFCGHYIKINERIGFTYNCDAGPFCMSAIDPARLLEKNAVRQPRPLYIVAAAIIGRPIQWLINQFHIPVLHKVGDKRAFIYAGYYAAYVLLNYLLLLSSLFLFDKIIHTITDDQMNQRIFFAFLVVLVSNEVTKLFFWTAHQQFFSLFTPLLTVYCVIRIQQKRLTINKLQPLSALCGVSMLVYGNFLPMYGYLLLSSYLVDRKLHVPHLIACIMTFLLPTLAWISICVLVTGSYYNIEIELYRQLVWIIDSLKISFGHFLETFYGFIIKYLKTFREITVFVLAMIFLSVFSRKAMAEKAATVRGLVLTLTIFFLFFLILGYYAERLTFTLYPPILCILAFQVHHIKWLRNDRGILVLLAIIWHLFNLLSYGPFS
jgi:hypothetical protein